MPEKIHVGKQLAIMTVLKPFPDLVLSDTFLCSCYMFHDFIYLKKLIWIYVLFDLGKVRILVKKMENSSLAQFKSDISKYD